MRSLSRPTCWSVLAVLPLALGVPGRAEAQPAARSWVIAGARVADGTGQPLRAASVRVEGDRIAKVGTFRPRKGEEVVRADGLVLAPGFIDAHNHSTEGLEHAPAAETQVSQGITTLLLGQDGSSPWPIAEYLRQRRRNPAAVNLLVLVGHATVRREVMGDDFRRAARAEEVAQMERLVAQAMREGAVGLSSGLEYDVGGYAATDEVVALARVAARHRGFYISHIRDEADRSFEAIREAIAIGERARIPVQITHLKLGSVAVWGKASEAVRLVEDARRRGLAVAADCYPYTAWHSGITVLVPNRQVEDPASVAKALADVGGAQNVVVAEFAPRPEYETQTLEAIARARGITPVALFIEIVRAGGASVIGHTMTEDDVRAFYQQPWVMVASDGGIGMRHPRAAGTFPKVLGEFVRERKWLALEEAVRKMTSLPAARLGLNDRGRIARGKKADLVLFDPARVRDRSTFERPALLAEGVEKVWVNGALVWEAGGPTGARPGRVLPR